MRLILTLICIMLPLYGCAVQPSGRYWGERGSITPGWQRLGDGLSYALSSPGVWGALAGSLGLQAFGGDERISSWATQNTPLFGSPQRADDWSSRLSAGSEVLRVAAALGAPAPADPGGWAAQKGGGLLVGYLAHNASHAATTALKRGISRERPNAANRLSYPSGHSSTASVHATMAAATFAYYPGPERTRLLLRAGSYSIAAATGWARVEAGVHYPSDVLAGFALGHFFGRFFSYSFWGVASETAPIPVITPLPGGGMLRLSYRF